MNSNESASAAWWREGRFGMFIHWGVYAVPAGVHKGRIIRGASEWLMHHAAVPVAEYRNYAREFNPVNYDPEAWVRSAVDAGMSYLVITAKHHDGFALFPSKASGWNIADSTPYGRDLLGPLVEACRRAGLPIGFYYSQAQDWVNGGRTYADNWDHAQDRNFDDYLDHVAIPQIRELLTSYGPGTPSVLWWDTPAEMTPERAGRINAAVQEHAPSILQNDRLGGGFLGDFDTPEQRIPSNRPARAWETCMTTNESWGFNAHDNNWKPPGLLIRQLCEVVSQGGNYLLNIGPKADGTMPEQSLSALREIGRWMRINSVAIRSAGAGPFPHRLPWGFATRNGTTLYLLIESWPADGLLRVPLLDVPDHACLLAEPQASLTIEPGAGEFLLRLPRSAIDPAVSVAALQFSTEPRLGNVPSRPRPPVIQQPADGTLKLAATEAEIIGDHLALMAGVEPTLGCWTSLESHPLWRVAMHRAGTYRVELVYAVPPHREGTVAEVVFGDKRLPFAAESTGGWGEFRCASAGVVSLLPDKELHVRVIPVAILVGAVMDLRAIVLTPTADSPL
jgi:alpha-L-fucosidase